MHNTLLLIALCRTAYVQNSFILCETLWLLNHNYQFFPLPGPWLPPFYSVCVSLPILDTLLVESCSICFSVFVFFTQHNVLQAYLYCCIWQGFFLRLNIIPLHVCTTFIFIHQWTFSFQKSSLSFWHFY